jgi:hypothetical protein
MRSSSSPDQASIYGLLAAFDTPEALLTAVRRSREAGYEHMEAYTPFPVEGLAEAMGFRRTRVPLVVLIGGIVGGLGGFFLQYWINVIHYPLNVGGRPLFSWPAFVPVTFELTILIAALAAILGMLALNGLPMPYHPLFNVPQFEGVTRDGFFLCIEAVDAQFDRAETRQFLETLTQQEVYDVAL